MSTSPSNSSHFNPNAVPFTPSAASSATRPAVTPPATSTRTAYAPQSYGSSGAGSVATHHHPPHRDTAPASWHGGAWQNQNHRPYHHHHHQQHHYQPQPQQQQPQPHVAQPYYSSNAATPASTDCFPGQPAPSYPSPYHQRGRGGRHVHRYPPHHEQPAPLPRGRQGNVRGLHHSFRPPTDNNLGVFLHDGCHHPHIHSYHQAPGVTAMDTMHPSSATTAAYGGSAPIGAGAPQHYHHHLHHHYDPFTPVHARPSSEPASCSSESPCTAPPQPVRALPSSPKPELRWEPSPTNPVTVLFLGCRGSGKSTQSTLLANHHNLLRVSSGDLYKQGDNPFLVLRKLVEEHFGPGGSGKYNGLSLDRFIVISELDAYYLQWALSAASLPLPEVFLISMDVDAAMQRAASREGEKPSSESRRIMEHQAQFAACETLYVKAGVLHRLSGDPVFSAEVIHEVVKREVQKALETRLREATEAPRPLRPVRELPPCGLLNHPALPMITDYAIYHSLKAKMHNAIGNFTGKYDSAPISSMSGYVDRNTFATKRQLDFLKTYFVTLKANGSRLVVVKHRTHGFLGLPQKMTCAFNINALFKGFVDTPATNDERPVPADLEYSYATSLTSSADPNACTPDVGTPIDMILDCEYIEGEGENAMPRLLVFDYVYFFGSVAKRVWFKTRLQHLQTYFMEIPERPNTSHVSLKEYRPACELRTLLPSYGAAPFAIDGIVFQYNGTYRYGADKDLLKWKPTDQCTVDFRLCNGTEDAKNAQWRFELQVVDDSSQTLGEVKFHDAYTIVTQEEMDRDNLCEGSIVELIPERATEVERHRATESKAGSAKVVKSANAVTTDTPSPPSKWLYVRCRQDKLLPNKYSIATKICSFDTVQYTELLAYCDGLR